MSDTRKETALRYLGMFGDVKPSELGYAKSYMCPKCKGEGMIHSYSCDGRDDRHYKCDLCGGAGYTDREYKPRMVQNGWE